MTLMKAILGLCLGLALMAALQTVGVWSLQEHIKSQSNAGLPIGNTPVVGNFDADALKNGILPKFGPIETREGQRLAIEGAARRIDLQNRAVQKYLPRYHSGTARRAGPGIQTQAQYGVLDSGFSSLTLEPRNDEFKTITQAAPASR